MNRKVWRPIVEVAFIIFLFYSNLLMGEFERANSSGGKSLSHALARDQRFDLCPRRRKLVAAQKQLPQDPA
jgi:hypothetical protein